MKNKLSGLSRAAAARFLVPASAALFIFLSVMLPGCGAKTEKFGAEVSVQQPVSVKSLLTSPDEFAGRELRIEGTIRQECPSGCWFILDDSTGSIYVDLGPSQIAIPQAVGRRVAAQGIIKKEGPKITFSASGVILQ